MTDSDEKWCRIDGYMDYRISSTGKVESLKGGRPILIRPKLTRAGYLSVGLYKDGKRKFFFVHRLVATAFVLNLNGDTQVNHINGNKEDNRAANLEWCTASENSQHAFDTGLSRHLPERQQAATRAAKDASSKRVHSSVLKCTFVSARDAARQTGVSQQNISACCRGRRKSAGKHPETGEKLTWHFA